MSKQSSFPVKTINNNEKKNTYTASEVLYWKIIISKDIVLKKKPIINKKVSKLIIKSTFNFSHPPQY